MTPLEISRFMSEQFIIDKITLKLLEPGIGSGVLACSLCEYIAQKNKKVNRIESRTKKHFMDLIKMISYRAETAMTYIINEKAMDIDEARCLLKQIYKTEVDLKVNISFSDGTNKISIFAVKEVSGKKYISGENSLTIRVISSVSPPIISFPASGSSIAKDNKNLTIRLMQSTFQEWSNIRTLEITGLINYNQRLTIPDVKGEWKSSDGKGLEGEITLSLIIGNESYEYISRSDATGNFAFSLPPIDLSYDYWTTKFNNDDVDVQNETFQYLWQLEEGVNNLNISAMEKSISISMKIKGKVEDLESRENSVSYSSPSLNASYQLKQQLDSRAPMIIRGYFDGKFIKIDIIDADPTSGIDNNDVEAVGIGKFSRIDGSLTETDSTWRLRYNKPPLPPGIPFRLKVKVKDRAKNEIIEDIVIFND
jgi:hypothetical protein